MNYKKENIKKGVCLHTIETNKFKTTDECTRNKK